MLVFLSLWSFSLQDIGWFALSESETVEAQGNPHNLVGLVGAYIAASLIWFLGSASLAIPFLILLHGIRVFQEERKSVKSILGSVLLVLCMSTLVWLHHPLSVQSLQDGITSGVYAGQAGAWTAGELKPLFGQWGSTVLLASLLPRLPLAHHALFPVSRGRTHSEGRGEDGRDWYGVPAWHWPAWLKDRWEPKANQTAQDPPEVG